MRVCVGSGEGVCGSGECDWGVVRVCGSGEGVIGEW